jgi:TonB family protein
MSATRSPRVALVALAGAACVLTTLVNTTTEARQDGGAPVRVGGNVPAPQRTRYVTPVYPAFARANRIEGVVIIEATIDRDGRVTDARVLRSIEALDRPALDAVRQWEYEPVILNGVPVAAIMTVSVAFSLSNTAAPESAVVTSPADGAVAAVGFTAGDQLVAVTRFGIDVWDVAHKTVVRRHALDASYFPLFRTLSPDGKTLAAHVLVTPGTGRGGLPPTFDVRLVNVETGAADRLQSVGRPGPLAISGDGRLLLRVTSSATQRGATFDVWRMPSREVAATGEIPLPEAGPVAVAITRTGHRFALATHLRSSDTPFPAVPYGRIYVVDTASGRVLSTIRVPGIPRALQFSNDGERIYLTHDQDRDIWMADTLGRDDARPLDETSPGPSPTDPRGGTPPIVTLLHAADSPRLFATNRTGQTLQIWDTNNGRRLGTISPTAYPTALGLRSDERMLAVGTISGVEVFDVRDAGVPVKVF